MTLRFLGGVSVLLNSKAHVAFVSVMRAIRLEKRLTQRAMAKRCAKPASFISKIEAFQRDVSLFELPIIAKGLGVSEEALYNRYIAWRDA